MNEELRRCLESITKSITEIDTMKDITIGEIYAAVKEYGLSKEMTKIIFSL